jgi:ABC-type multidrug transport system fused ATPase/permease subunit
MLNKIYNFYSVLGKLNVCFIVVIIFFLTLLEVIGINLIYIFFKFILSGPAEFLNNKFLKLLINDNIYNYLITINFNNFIFYFVFLLIFFFLIKTLFFTLGYFFIYNKIFWVNEFLSKKIFYSYLNESYINIASIDSSIIVRNILEEVSIVVNRFFLPVIFICSELFLIISIFLFLLIIEPIITIALIFLAIILGSFIFFFTKKKSSFYGKQRQHYFPLRYQNIVETFKSILTIKLMHIEDFVYEYFKFNHKKTIEAEKSIFMLNILPKFFFEFIGIVIFCLLIIFSYSFYNNMDLIIPLFAVYAICFFRILPSVNRIVVNLNSLQYSQKSSELISNEFLFSHSSIQAETKLTTIEFASLNFSDVNFSYNKKNANLLNNLNFSINKGDFVGIVGKSGSGKSTLVLILLGFIKPTKGTVIINNKYDLYLENLNWGKLVGYVPQETYLVNDSIKKNIAFGFGKNEIDNYKILQIIDLLDLNETINRLEDGLDTYVGEGGSKLSGGEKQRISIARLLYRNPELIVFDEPTNSLDPATEIEILKIITKINKSKTIIMVSHNYNNLKNCNKVFEISKQSLNKIII